MLKKVIALVALVGALATSFATSAAAQDYYDRGWRHDRGWDDRGWDGHRHDWRRRHHHHDHGSAIAGGLAGGVIGGIIAGSIENSGPRYYRAPARECWYERRTVQNQYDYGYHTERVRICN